MATQFANGKIVTDGLVLCLDAADLNSYPTTGTTWFDLAGSNNGTLTNGPTFNSSNGGSIVLDGTNDEILLSSPITFISSGSVNAWVKYNDVSGDLTLASGDGYGEGYWIYSAGSTVYTNWGSSYATFNDLKSFFVQNEKFYLTLTYGNNFAKIYKNGILIGSQSYTQSSNGVLRSFGRLYTGSGSYTNMNGNIYCSQIYNRELTNSEVLQNYNAQKARFGIS
jgi:hypothetical protein